MNKLFTKFIFPLSVVILAAFTEVLVILSVHKMPHPWVTNPLVNVYTLCFLFACPALLGMRALALLEQSTTGLTYEAGNGKISRLVAGGLMIGYAAVIMFLSTLL